MSLTGHSEAALEAALPAPIVVRRIRSAKRLRLRFDERSRTFSLTCPWRMCRRTALAWAVDQREWIEGQLARAVPGLPFVPGSTLPVNGQTVTVVWDPNARRKPALGAGELRVGGPLTSLPRRIETFLKAHALEVMSRDVADYAAVIDVKAAGVSVGDAGTRWGSCSSKGRIRLSWRLICAPVDVRRFVVAHEDAHLVHLDHSTRFKALEAKLYGPGLQQARSELRRIGPRLRRIGLSN